MIDSQRESVELTLVVVLPATAVEARALAEEFGATVVEDPRRGISEAINVGVASATDEQYYAWMGDDDLFRVGALVRLRALLEENPAAVVSYGGCDYIDPNGRTIGTSRAGRLARWLLPWGPNLVPHPGSMIRLDALRTAGLFDPDLKYTMDLDIFLKLRRLGDFVSTKHAVSAFRWHPNSLTVSSRRESGAEAEMVKCRHLPVWLRPIAPVWHVPVRWASNFAARSVSSRAIRIGADPKEASV